MKNNPTRKITYLALFSAVIFFTTAFLAIPSAVGFTNIGDTFVLVSSFLFGPVFSAVCGGVGSALGDVYLGFSIYAPFTLVIKGLEGFIAALLARLFYKLKINFIFSLILAFLTAVLFMAAGYFFTNALCFGGFSPAFAELPKDLLQALINLTLSVVICVALPRIKGIKGVSDNEFWEAIYEKNSGNK